MFCQSQWSQVHKIQDCKQWWNKCFYWHSMAANSFPVLATVGSDINRKWWCSHRLFCAMTVHGPSSLWICSTNDRLILTFPAGWYAMHLVHYEFTILISLLHGKKRGWNNICMLYKNDFLVMLFGRLLEEDGEGDSVSSVVSKCDESKISTYFPRHPISLVLWSSQQAICIRLHASQAPCLPSTDHYFLPQDPCRSARPGGQTTRLPNTNGSV